MDQDPYTHSRLLYKSDRNIASIYSQVMRLAMGESVNQEQLLREIDSLIFQNFKYKTAILSVQKDHEVNASTQSKADLNIQKSKTEIQQLGEQVKMAESIRKRKIQFNELVHSIKQFETHRELEEKISTVEREIKELEEKYEEEIASFAEKQRCLRIALSALNVFLGSESV